MSAATPSGATPGPGHYLEVADELSGEALAPGDTIPFIEQVANET